MNVYFSARLLWIKRLDAFGFPGWVYAFFHHAFVAVLAVLVLGLEDFELVVGDDVVT